MDTKEENIQKAIVLCESNASFSIRAAAKACNVSRSTLANRLDGRTNCQNSHESQMRLSQVQEKYLADWIIEQDIQGHPPSFPRVREMASRILVANEDTRPLGRKWVQKFVQRNPEISSCIGRQIDSRRTHGTTQTAIDGFFKTLDTVVRTYNISTDNIWNMDETGIALGVCTNTRVLARAGKKRTYTESPENREWVSIIEAVSAGGATIPPTIIFKGLHLQTSWFGPSIPDWRFATSENGWTSNNIAIDWLKTIFHPRTKPIGNQVRLLLVDGHGSHENVEFMWLCKQYNIQMVFLPAHSSHVLQPLDLSVFSSLKTAYRTEVTKLAYIDEAAPIQKQRFLSFYETARTKAFTKSNIRSGWKAAGICPWNPQKALQSSQLSNLPKTPPEQAPKTNLNFEDVFQTPTNQRHIQTIVQSLDKDRNLTRNCRAAFTKAGKSIGRLISQSAQQEAVIQHQELVINELKNAKSRKRVRIDPNLRFADVESIRASIQEHTNEQVRTKRVRRNPAVQTATQAQETPTFESCLSEFQL